MVVLCVTTFLEANIFQLCLNYLAFWYDPQRVYICMHACQGLDTLVFLRPLAQHDIIFQASHIHQQIPQCDVSNANLIHVLVCFCARFAFVTSVSNINIDLMHCGCLGVVQYLLGNILYELFTDELGGSEANQQSQVAHLLLLIRQASKSLRRSTAPLNNLTYTMFKPARKSPPKMKTKASEGRALLTVVQTMLENYFHLNTRRQVMRYLCLRNLVAFYNTLDTWTGPSSGVKAKQYGRKI